MIWEACGQERTGQVAVCPQAGQEPKQLKCPLPIPFV